MFLHFYTGLLCKCSCLGSTWVWINEPLDCLFFEDICWKITAANKTSDWLTWWTCTALSVKIKDIPKRFSREVDTERSLGCFALSSLLCLQKCLSKAQGCALNSTKSCCTLQPTMSRGLDFSKCILFAWIHNRAKVSSLQMLWAALGCRSTAPLPIPWRDLFMFSCWSSTVIYSTAGFVIVSLLDSHHALILNKSKYKAHSVCDYRPSF